MLDNISSDKSMKSQIDFGFDNTFACELSDFAVPCSAERVPKPKLIKFNRALARELGLNTRSLETKLGAEIFAETPYRMGRLHWPKLTRGISLGTFHHNLEMAEHYC